MKKETDKTQGQTSPLNADDQSVLLELREAYRMVEASRKTLGARKVKHALEQQIFIKSRQASQKA